MKTQTIKNKNGETYTNENGVELVENVLEVGDKFVLKFDKILEEKSSNGLVNYSILCQIMDKDGKKYSFPTSREEDKSYGFVKITEGQAKNLKSLQKSGHELHRTKFVAYSYDNEFGSQIGVGLADRKPALSLDEL